MGTEKISIRDELSLRIKEGEREEMEDAAKESPKKVRGPKKGSPKKMKSAEPDMSNRRPLAGSGPWYVFVDAEPEVFYAVSDISIVLRLRRQKGWHTLQSQTLVWRLRRLKDNLKPDDPRKTLFEGLGCAVNLERALRTQMEAQQIEQGILGTVPPEHMKQHLRRLVVLVTQLDAQQPIQPSDLELLAAVFSIQARELYLRARNAEAPIPFRARCDDAEYPWGELVVWASSEADVRAWIRAQWMFHHYESLAQGKTLRQRMAEYDRVIKAEITVVPAWSPGRVVAMGIDQTFRAAESAINWDQPGACVLTVDKKRV